MMAAHHDPREAMEAAAAEWAIRLGGEPLPPETRAELNRWLAESPAHGEALEFALSTWTDLGGLRHAPGSLARHLPARRPPQLRFWGNAAALAASLALIATLGLLWFGDPRLILTADERTAPGEIRLVTLPDGSRVELGPASALAVHYDGQSRRVELLAGRAYFAPLPTAVAQGRPFVVEAAEGTATALGTQFMVERREDNVTVTVTEHQVEVTLAQGESAVLAPGQSVRYAPDTRLSPVRNADIRHATAWRDGRLIFDRVPLAEVVDELNRYRRGRIVIAQPDLAGRTVSGMFDTARLDDALSSIAQELGVQERSIPPFLTVLY